MINHKILLLENIHPSAEEAMKAVGFQVQTLKGALSEAELISALKDHQVVGLRSKTQITKRVLEESPHLMAVGAFCIGTNQVDLEVANHLGIPVFNAPYSNTRSVAELVIAEMVALSRRLGDINMKAHVGEWAKSATGSFEIRGKTLGIVGYGHIGSQLSVLAESLGLRVLYFDIVKKLPLGNAHAVDHLHDLLAQSDFVSLHVPETPLTPGLIGPKEIAAMKKGSYLINASRGSVVDIESLVSSLKSGHLQGAAIDVFPMEPANNQEKFESPLQGLPNVILTPHIGGSTEEAQESIGKEVSHSLVEYLLKGMTLGAVNFPQLEIPPLREEAIRILNIHENVPGVLGKINSLVSQSGANIRAQYLSTDSEIGYLVMDLEVNDGQHLCDEIQNLSTSIKSRVIS